MDQHSITDILFFLFKLVYPREEFWRLETSAGKYIVLDPPIPLGSQPDEPGMLVLARPTLVDLIEASLLDRFIFSFLNRRLLNLSGYAGGLLSYGTLDFSALLFFTPSIPFMFTVCPGVLLLLVWARTRSGVVVSGLWVVVSGLLIVVSG